MWRRSPKQQSGQVPNLLAAVLVVPPPPTNTSLAHSLLTTNPVSAAAHSLLSHSLTKTHEDSRLGLTKKTHVDSEPFPFLYEFVRALFWLFGVE